MSSCFGVCYLQGGELRYAHFDAECLSLWLKNRGVQVDLKWIRDSRPGQTHLYVTRHQMVIWHEAL
jgi:hypothetical protein